jgi:acyl carrier protein
MASEVQGEEIGEIAVKSRYLTPGYWRRPDLTRAVLLPAEGDQRIYRTGDIGRMLRDGCLLCLGRKDSQVKIRGHRVEIAEIEMALLNLGTIKAAVVIARRDRPDDHRLVAYLVPKEHPAPTVTKLRHALAETLPEHMIPSIFVLLDDLPLAPNGKINRAALPDPGNSRPELDTAFVAPRTRVEQKLAQIWTEILSLDSVGVHDNFFDLGGHSLAATRVVSQVIKQFQLELPLQSLFQSPTVAEMAAVINHPQGKQLGQQELDRILTELESISDEDAKRLLADPSGTEDLKD